jgi:hypothetical protein
MATAPPPVAHTLFRKQMLAKRGPIDNAGSITASVNSNFDLGSTIFKSLPAKSLGRVFQNTKLDETIVWSEEVAAAIEADYTSLPKQVSSDDGIFKFMFEECDFSIEHADGSFLDHLYFCRDYGALHYPEESARVLLLHSICGVGTNCFPMSVSKLPMLKTLLSLEEYCQIEAFPSILRLLVHGPLLAELLAAESTKLEYGLRAVRFRRLLDNEPLELSADQLWKQLNFQLIHAMDFLPPAAWQRTGSTYFFHIFDSLHRLLTAQGKLGAKIDWSGFGSSKPLLEGARPNTWRHWLVDLVPSAVVLRLASKQIAKYSAAVGHSLEYELVWA